MSDDNNGERKSQILSLNEVREKHRKVSREELDADLTELSLAMYGKHESLSAHVTQQVALLKRAALLQQQLIAGLEARTLRGRIRRMQAWWAAEWALWREIVRDRLGIEPSPTVARLRDAEAEQLRAALDRADANPEAMPKP